MRIIHVEDYFDPSAGYQINELLKVQGKDNEVYLITSDDLSPFHKTLNLENDRKFEQKYNIKIIRLKILFKLASRVWIKGLFYELEKLDPDIVYMHGIGDFKDLVLLNKKRSYLIIRDCHMSWIASRRKFSRAYYFFYKIIFSKQINKNDKYYRIYALGKEEKEYIQALGICEEKIQYLLHGYNDDEMYYSPLERKNIRSTLMKNEDKVLIGYVGKFDYDKQPDLIFDIIDNLNPHLKDKIELIFIGPRDIQYYKSFKVKEKEFIEKNKIEIITLLPQKFTDLYKYFSAIDICIFPKECTLSSIHAQCCKCIVLMEDHDSNKERVIDNNTLFEKNNIFNATKKLENIMNSEEYIFYEDVLKNIKKREYKNQNQKIINEWTRAIIKH